MGAYLERALKKDLQLISLLFSRCCWVSAAAPCPGGKGLPGAEGRAWRAQPQLGFLHACCQPRVYLHVSLLPCTFWKRKSCWVKHCCSGWSDVVQTRFPPPPSFNRPLFDSKQPPNSSLRKSSQDALFFCPLLFHLVPLRGTLGASWCFHSSTCQRLLHPS